MATKLSESEASSVKMNPLDETERTTQVLYWLTQYGKWIGSFIGVAIVGMAVWQYTQYHHHQQRIQAAAVYAQFTRSQDHDEATRIADDLMAHYAATPYAKLAALAQAQKAVAQHQLDQAQVPLQWVVDHRQQALLSQLAQLRLARILIAQQQPQAALAMLHGAEQIYPLATQLVRARALRALGKTDMARTVLLQLQATPAPPDNPLLPLVQIYV